ncbi:DNA photolyase phr1 [Stygiomarasmius scandens]|uniref:DNA photolyase phr1 n=1 Tax=Marasmiellus scandens TaxID=2682957 RepID=A0ABR1K0H1_9AGAR
MPAAKRRLPSSPTQPLQKRQKSSTFNPRKVATADAAAAVDRDPPLLKLLSAIENGVKKTEKGSSIVYWMRMADLRISDNRALSQASSQAHKEGIPLVVLFAISPQDYTAHDRGARRIDFTLRNLALIRDSLAKLHIPLHTITHNVRKTLPSCVVSLLKELKCTNLYGNIEYEVDELRRDIHVCHLAKASNISVHFVHNKCIVEPGLVKTKEDTAYAVYSPYQRNWLSTLNDNVSRFIDESPEPHPNSEQVRKSKEFSHLFETTVPESIPGFELVQEDRKTMETVWPAGEDTALEILDRFLHTKARSSQMGIVSPLADGAETSDKASRIAKYNTDRDDADRDTTSRLSPYLSAGIISVRACVRATLKLQKNSKKVDGGKETGIGRWIQELAWRDFYTNILVYFPRVSMGRPYLEKYADIVWEVHRENQADSGYEGDPVGDGTQDSDGLKRWKQGTTGVPVVDAAMRCVNQMGWVHNRFRMIAAMFLTKDLMIDWRVGEKYFMQNLIDGDLASNNGGWQWSASTGVDPAPYFRIFNPYSQSTKVDPTGDFIRHFVPELAKLRGDDLHNPSASLADKLGYPRPVVKHHDVRDRALRRFKNPGEK